MRRYVAALQELGIPVEGQRGVGGGYRMRPGYRLPPLMLTDDEAVAVVLGLLARAARLGVGGAVDGALAKIHRVLPDAAAPPGRGARGDARLHRGSARAAAPVRGDAALLLADAIRRRRRLRAALPHVLGRGERARAQPARARRPLRPLVPGRVRPRPRRPAHVPGRPDVARGHRGGAGARRRRTGFDAVAHVSRSLARVPWNWEVEVLLDLPLDEAAQRIPATLAELIEAEDGTLLRMRVGSLDWMAGVLAGLDCAFAIRRPDELRESVRALAERLTASVA